VAGEERRRERPAARVPISTILTAAVVAAVVSAVVSILTTLVFGAVSGAWNRHDNLQQEGQIVFPGAGSREVYYPQAYQSPPHLQVTQDGGFTANFTITEQKQDHFKVELSNTSFNNTVTLRWRAEGTRRK
jgi:hypothetical protein